MPGHPLIATLTEWEMVLGSTLLLMVLLLLKRPGPPSSQNVWDEWIVWIAQGFGMGRIPFAPGTWGSLLGLLWFGLLVGSGSVAVYGAGVVLGALASVWICGTAEKCLGIKDPGSIVLDEIVAIPLCFAGWVTSHVLQGRGMPEPGFFLEGSNALWTLAVFGLFRLFDIAKPWPVRQTQSFPGGWGVTADDLAAAFYVNLVLFVVPETPLDAIRFGFFKS
ncbi:MAG: phosphatidylglycerophosphatase A [Opitutaceae bacterium]|nr:phosphatidylglycerophosphatase A [Verrucomicrobiales bacterium]